MSARDTEAYYRRQNVRQRRSRIPLTDRTVPGNLGVAANLDLPTVRINATMASVTVQRMNDNGGRIDFMVNAIATTLTGARSAPGTLTVGDRVGLRIVDGFTGWEEVRFYGADDNEIARTKIYASG